MLVISRGEVREVEVDDREGASLLGRYWAVGVGRFLAGDPMALEEFEGESVAGRPLETDPAVIEALAFAGMVDIDDVYSLWSP